MGLFDIFGSDKKKKSRKAREGRRRGEADRGRRRIDDDEPDGASRRRRSPDGERGGSDRRRSREGGRRRRSSPPPPGDERGDRRRKRGDDPKRRGGGRKRRPPRDGDEEPRRRRGRRREGEEPEGGGRRKRRDREGRGRKPPKEQAPGSGSFDDEDDVFVIKPEGDKATVERKKRSAKNLKDGKFEISVGTPTLTGEGTTGEGGILQTVLKSKVTGDLKPTLKEARLKKVEKTVTDIQLKVQVLEESTGAIRSDLTEIKESVSRMEIAVNDVEDIKEEYNNMEKSLRELSALYDLLSSYTNPFIESIDLPKRTHGFNEGGEEEAPAPNTEDKDFELDELSRDVNPFVDELESSPKPSSKSSPGSDGMITGEPAMDINRDFWMLKWAKYLSVKVNSNQVHKLLGYYRNLGWIEGEIEEKMLTYFDGSRIDQTEDMMDSDTIITEDGKVLTEASEDAWKMSMDDHSKSLEYIGKIKSKTPIDQ